MTIKEALLPILLVNNQKTTIFISFQRFCTPLLQRNAWILPRQPNLVVMNLIALKIVNDFFLNVKDWLRLQQEKHRLLFREKKSIHNSKRIKRNFFRSKMEWNRWLMRNKSLNRKMLRLHTLKFNLEKKRKR